MKVLMTYLQKQNENLNNQAYKLIFLMTKVHKKKRKVNELVERITILNKKQQYKIYYDKSCHIYNNIIF